MLVNTFSSRDQGILGGGFTPGRVLEGMDHIISIGRPRADAVKFGRGTPGIRGPRNVRLRDCRVAQSFALNVEEAAVDGRLGVDGDCRVAQSFALNVEEAAVDGRLGVDVVLRRAMGDDTKPAWAVKKGVL